MTYVPKKDLFSLLREINRNLDAESRRGTNAHPDQAKILMVIVEKDGMYQGDLVKELGLNANSVSIILRKLEKEELVVRKQNIKGKKSLFVAPTEAGRSAALEDKCASKDRDQELFGSLTSKERAELTRVLNKLLDNWDLETDDLFSKSRGRRWEESAQLQRIHREIQELITMVKDKHQTTTS